MAKMKLRGGLHMHTVLSHDGKMTLQELADFLKGKGYDYIAVTEHSYDIDAESMERLVEQATQLSSDDFLVIPGIEFRCEGWVDIAGYGVAQTCDSEDPVTIINHIHSHGGVAVLAHPNVRVIPIEKSWVMMLDGCEIWNVTNEGKYLPRSGGIGKFRELTRLNPGLLAFTALDLHHTESYCRLGVETYTESLDRMSVLKALKAGQFRSVSPLFSVNSKGNVPHAKRIYVTVGGSLLDGLRKVRDIIRS